MALYENPWAQGMGNLGTALFGSPQDDVAISQAQSQQALRQRRLREAEAVQQQMRADAQNRDFLQTGLQTVFSDNVNNPASSTQVAGALANLALADPELRKNPGALGEMFRLASGVQGGTPEQRLRGATGEDTLMDLQEQQQQQAWLEGLAQQDPEAAQFLAGQGAGAISELPDWGQKMMAARNLHGAGLGDAFLSATGATDTITDDYGNAYDIGPRYLPDNDRVTQLIATGDPARLAGGRAPQGVLGRARAGVGQPPQAGQQPPPAPAGQGAQQPPMVERSGQEDVPGLGDTRPARPEGYKAQRVDTGLGAVEMPIGPDDQSRTLFDMLENSSGMAVGAQRGLSDFPLGGQISDDLFFGDSVAMEAEMVHLNTEMRPLMTVSNRPSRWELQDIAPALLDPSVWRNPATNGKVMAVLHDRLTSGLSSANRDLESDFVDGQARQDLEAEVRHAEALLRKIGEPREISGAQVTRDRFAEIWQGITGSRESIPETGAALRDEMQQGGQQTDTGADDDLTDEQLDYLLQNYGSGGP